MTLPKLLLVVLCYLLGLVSGAVVIPWLVDQTNGARSWPDARDVSWQALYE